MVTHCIFSVVHHFIVTMEKEHESNLPGGVLGERFFNSNEVFQRFRHFLSFNMSILTVLLSILSHEICPSYLIKVFVHTVSFSFYSKLTFLSLSLKSTYLQSLSLSLFECQFLYGGAIFILMILTIFESYLFPKDIKQS